MKEKIELYKHESQIALDQIKSEDIRLLLEHIQCCLQHQNKIFICGNGGNVGLVQNMVADLCLHPFVSDDKKTKSTYIGPRLKVYDLCSNQALITAIANDLGYPYIFSEQLAIYGDMNDLLICISGSGTSPNIVQALDIARIKYMQSIIITKNSNYKTCDSIVITGNSQFPGQIGGNNFNFHFEDAIMKLTHIVVGLLKEKIQHA